MDNNVTANEQIVIVRRSHIKPQTTEQVPVRRARKVKEDVAMRPNNNPQLSGSSMTSVQLTSPASEKTNSVPQLSQIKRKKRRSKAEMIKLQKQLHLLLMAGYSLSSAPHILKQRKDNIGNRLMDEEMLNQLGNFSQEKKIVPCTSALCKLLGLPETSFIEITRYPRGGVLIVEASIEDIRRQLGISNE